MRKIPLTKITCPHEKERIRPSVLLSCLYQVKQDIEDLFELHAAPIPVYKFKGRVKTKCRFLGLTVVDFLRYADSKCAIKLLIDYQMRRFIVPVKFWENLPKTKQLRYLNDLNDGKVPSIKETLIETVIPTDNFFTGEK